MYIYQLFNFSFNGPIARLIIKNGASFFHNDIFGYYYNSSIETLNKLNKEGFIKEIYGIIPTYMTSSLAMELFPTEIGFINGIKTMVPSKEIRIFLLKELYGENYIIPKNVWCKDKVAWVKNTNQCLSYEGTN